MARKLLDLAKDKIETLFGKIEDNFAELYQDKTQKDQEIQSLATGVNNAKSIHGLTDPLVTTAANYVGQQYTNTLTGDQFTCVSISGDDQKIYTWLPSNSAVLQTIKDALNGKVDWSKFSNTNLLDNWYFVNPINQRGQSEYTGAIYGIDRWFGRNSSSIIEINDGSVSIGSSSPDSIAGGFRQKFDFDIPAGSILTFSVLTDDNKLYTGTGEYDPDSGHTYALSVALGLGFGSGFADIFSRSGYEDDSRNLIAAKLEFGSIQTLAHKEGDTWVLNDPPPNTTSELDKCRRYQLPLIDRVGNYGGPLGYGFTVVSNASTQFARICIPVPSSMRVTPVLIWLSGTINNLRIYDNAGMHEVGEVIVQGNYFGQIFLLCKSTSDLDPDSVCILRLISSGIPMLDSNL